MDLVILVLSFAIILAGAELFTNGIEWFGHKLGLAEGAVGSVLAAIGTALPETTIPVIAILFSVDHHSDEIGVGAILGAPFMLATLAMFVAGLVVLQQGRSRSTGDALLADPTIVAKDVRTFLVTYAVAIAAAIFLPSDPTWPKLLVALVLVVGYGWYVKGHFESDETVNAADLAPLRMHRFDPGRARVPEGVVRLRIVNMQVVVALVLIVVGAVLFVDAVGHIATTLGVSQVLLALVVAPIATELPEGFNSIIWIRQGKDTLAMGNITGAMVFQAAIPTSVALVFAPTAWVAAPGTYLAFSSAAIAFLATFVLFLPLVRGVRLRGRWLLLGGGFYAAYLAIVGIGIATG